MVCLNPFSWLRFKFEGRIWLGCWESIVSPSKNSCASVWVCLCVSVRWGLLKSRSGKQKPECPSSGEWGHRDSGASCDPSRWAEQSTGSSYHAEVSFTNQLLHTQTHSHTHVCMQRNDRLCSKFYISSCWQPICCNPAQWLRPNLYYPSICYSSSCPLWKTQKRNTQAYADANIHKMAYKQSSSIDVTRRNCGVLTCK